MFYNTTMFNLKNISLKRLKEWWYMNNLGKEIKERIKAANVEL